MYTLWKWSICTSKLFDQFIFCRRRHWQSCRKIYVCIYLAYIAYWVLGIALCIVCFLSICINYRTGMIWVKVNYTSCLTLNSRIYHRGPRMFKGMNPSQCSSNHSQFLSWKPGLPVSRVNFQNLTYCVNLGNLCEFCELGEFVEMCLLDELKDEVGERMCTKLG